MLLVGNEETGQWMRNSAMDNPKFLSRTIGDWLNSWQTAKKPTKSYSDVPALKLDEGEYTFRNHCAACHTIGRGEHFGPDLAGVTARRDRDWLTRFIVDPEEVRAAGDPIALALRAKYQQVVMPSLDLGPADAAVLIDYIDRQSRAVSETPASSAAANDARRCGRADDRREPEADAGRLPADSARRCTSTAWKAWRPTRARSPPKRRSSGAGGAAIQAPAGELENGWHARRSARGIWQVGRRDHALREGIGRDVRRRRQGGVLPDGEQAMAAEGRRRCRTRFTARRCPTADGSCPRQLPSRSDPTAARRRGAVEWSRACTAGNRARRCRAAGAGRR